MGSKELFMIMREADFKRLSDHSQAFLNHHAHIEVREENEYETHMEDPNYRKLHKTKREASKALQQYLFDKRHGRNTN